MLQGALFTRDYLAEGITETSAWQSLEDAEVAAFREAVAGVYDSFPTGQKPSEAKTEDDLIWKVLTLLGWEHASRQVNLSPKGMDHKPDGLLFADETAKTRADARAHDYQRYADGLAIVESKRWLRELDRKGSLKDDLGVPSTQMIRYLDRVNIVTHGAVRWGILTNGRHWRLYYEGATSVSEEFLELDLTALAGIPGFDPGLFDGDPAHFLKVFMLMFGRKAFLLGADGRTFHKLSLEEGRLWEQKVAKDLSNLAFGTVFPGLVKGIFDHDRERPASEDPEYLDEVRDAALILLYRLLFVLYAEDRNLLPARDGAYAAYGMRKRVREDVATRVDRGDSFSARAAGYYDHMLRLFALVDEGDPGIGLPPYNGGLFAVGRPGARILQRSHIPDVIFAPVIDALSRHDDGKAKRRINYRDLSVQQLGSIYERLLENEVRIVDGSAVVGGDGEARHTSGSFYTPEAPVQLIIAKAVGPLLEERLAVFHAKADTLASDTRAKNARLKELELLDPATRMLEIKVCDPAMGSGHFLVSLVDYLGDRVLAAIAEAEAAVTWAEYESPLIAAIAGIRDGILAHARAGNWTLDEQQLEDRLIVRRMILKRVVYGVDKNPMAVELAKLSLWLHTFTVGAPLSFLEHHLRCGDSICGEWIRPIEDELDEMRATMFIRDSVRRARQTAQGMAAIERLSDADVAEVKLSKQTFEAIKEATEPLAHFLDFMHARRWIGGDIPAAHAATADALERRNLVLSPDTFVETAYRSVLTNGYGDPVEIATGAIRIPPAPRTKKKEPEPRHMKRTKGRPADYAPAVVQEVARELIELSRRLAEQEHFLHWQVAFPGVWDNWESAALEGGFDAVIGNPPYVRQELLSRTKPFLKEAYASFDGMADLYVYFYELALKILKPGGRLSLIVTNKWMKAGYAEALRDLFAERAWVEAVVDFGHAKQIFPDADVFPCVVVVRRPTFEPAPATARVCVIDRDNLDLDKLIQQVDNGSFDMPRAALDPSGWNLEPPAVLALMEKINRLGTHLSEFVGAKPYRGVLTGYNDAFLIEDSTRSALVAQDGRLSDFIRPYLRGQDIERWIAAWDNLWMIVLKSSANFPWPWANAKTEVAAEEIFRGTYPILHAHMKRHEKRLRARQDQGRYWWELRACSYYGAFDEAKIFYQEIQYHPQFAIDTDGRFGNNKTFFLPSGDLYLLGVLNSPLMWWYNWRYLPHMKDEALTPAGFKMEGLPIAEPSKETRSQIAKEGARLIAIKKDVAKSGADVLHWLRLEFDVTKLSQHLQRPAALSLDDFLAEVKKGRKGRLSPAALAALREGYMETVAPMRALIAEANTLERQVSDLVNQAYGLTPEEVDLMWRTAPPRMPFTA